MKIPASAPLLTLNSRANLEHLLPQLVEHFEDVYILDGNSTDGTQAYARTLGVRVERQFETDEPNRRIEDFRAMRLKLWSRAKLPWLFLTDADERLTPQLIERVHQIVAENDPTVVHRFRLLAALSDGTPIRHAFFYPNLCIRLFHKDSGLTLAGRKVHERFIVPPQISIVDHNEEFFCPWPSPDEYRKKIWMYAQLEGQGTPPATDAYLWRWVIWYNVRGIVGQFVRMIATSLCGWWRRERSLPWAYNWPMLWYRCLALQSGVRAWRRLRYPTETASCPTGATGHVGTFAFRRYGWPLYRCSACGHLWVHPLPSDAELAAFYSEGYYKGDATKRGYKDYDEDKKSVVPMFDRYLQRLESLTTARELLDIGAATGIFMARAKERGWKTRGLEISAYAADEARRKGLDVREARFEDVAENYRGVSVVTLWDVMEHFRDPFAVIRALGNIMPAGGVVMLNTPQSDSALARAMGKFWMAVAPPQHLHYFTRQSLLLAFARAGFDVKSVEWWGKTFSLAYLIHMAAGWLRLPSAWFCWLTDRSAIRRLNVSLNLYDVMVVVAEKK